MSFYRRNLPHIQPDFRVHFVTFATNERRSLPNWARSIVLSACRFHENRKYFLFAAVVMPDHVHLLINPLVEGNAMVGIEQITHSIKSFTAHEINKKLGRRAIVWQDESFDHVVRRGWFQAKLEYLLENPVRKGLTRDWRQYEWCYCHPESLR